ncbi:MAG: hypothetical protein AAGI71_09175 [Bacteroidota bacterium]
MPILAPVLRTLATAALALLGALAAPTLATAQDADPATLPLLGPGTYFGTTFYGNGDVPDAGSAAERLVEEGAAAGMNGFTLYVDWADLEPEPGVYDLSTFEASLAWFSRLGLRPFVNLTVVDIEDLNLPDEYEDENGDFADGWAFNNPTLVGRFLDVLDRVVPVLVQHGGYYLGLGNEVDGRYEAQPDEFADYLEFLAAAREHIRTLEPELAVGVTVTGGAPLGQTEVFAGLRLVSDVVPFNYYGLDRNFFAEDLTVIPQVLDSIMTAYGDDLTMVQETGCVSTAASGASLAQQADCMDVLLTTMRDTYPQIRYVSVFSLFDLDEDTCAFVSDFFSLADEDLPADLRERIRGFLCDVGMVTPEGTPKPAWPVFLNAASPTSTAPRPHRAQEGSVVVYPNPSSAAYPATLRLQLPASGLAMVRLVDVLGRELGEATIPVLAGTPAVLSLNELYPGTLPPGVYVVQARVGSAAQQGRLVVAR